MNLEAKPEIFTSRMRILTMPSLKFYYVTNEPVAFQDLDRQMDILLERLYYAKQKANLRGAGPDIIRFYKVEAQKNGNALFQMEVEIPLNEGLLAEGEAEGALADYQA